MAGSGLGIAAGIGQGVMQGLNFMRQREADQRADKALDMQTEVHDAQMQQIRRTQDDQQRTDTLDSLKTNIEANYQHLPAHERQQMYVKYGTETGLMKPADLDAAAKVRDQLATIATPDAWRALIGGNSAPMQSVLKTKGITLADDGGKYQITMPGSSEPQSIDKEGLLQLDAMATYRDQQAAQAKAALDRRKTLAEIGLKEADARLKDRLPVIRGDGEGKQPKPFDAVEGLSDYNKAWGVDPQTNQPYTWAPTGFQHYQQMLAANPEIAGGKDGQAYILNLSKALATGQAQAAPEINSDGKVQLVASWPGADGKTSPRKVVLQGAVDVGDLSQIQGVGGKQVVTGDQWAQIRSNGIGWFKTSHPADYERATRAAASPEGMSTLASLAQRNPDAARAYNFAKLIQQQGQYEAQKPQLPPSGKAAMTPEQKQTAQVLGINPDEPGLMESIEKAGGRLMDKARGFYGGLKDAAFENALARVKRYPDQAQFRTELFRLAKDDPARLDRINKEFGK